MKRIVISSVLLGMALAVPGSTQTAAAATQYIRIATLAPRGSELTRGFAKMNKGLMNATSDGWGIKLYPSGVAGDEKDVIRKMRVGQMDASIVTTTGLSQIVREVAVLNAPGVISNYKQLERVQKSMNTEWEETFLKNDFKLLAWGETGQYRWFSKYPINKPSDIKGHRPWLWPASHVMKEIYRATGANGVPLGLPEVLGALKTKMIDTTIATSIAVVALQWHGEMDHVTSDTFGVLLGAMIMNKKKWDSIPSDVQGLLKAEIKKNTEGDAKSVRRTDKKSYEKLIKRGYKASKYSAAGRAEYAKMAATVRSRLTGRIYPKALLDRVMKIAGKP